MAWSVQAQFAILLNEVNHLKIFFYEFISLKNKLKAFSSKMFKYKNAFSLQLS